MSLKELFEIGSLRLNFIHLTRTCSTEASLPCYLTNKQCCLMEPAFTMTIGRSQEWRHKNTHCTVDLWSGLTMPNLCVHRTRGEWAARR